MSRGGARAGAGRKTNAEIERVRELIDSVISDDDWKKVLANLLDIATTNKGYAAVQAAQLLCRYRFGVPVEHDPEPERDIVPIQYIEVDPLPNLRDDYDLTEDEYQPDATAENQPENDQSPVTHRASRAAPALRGQRQSPVVPVPPRPASGVTQPRPLHHDPRGRPGPGRP